MPLCVGKETALLQTLVYGLACAVGFILFLREGRKNKINSPQTAPPFQQSSNPINPYFVIVLIFLNRINLSRFGSVHLHTTDGNMRRPGFAKTRSHRVRHLTKLVRHLTKLVRLLTDPPLQILLKPTTKRLQARPNGVLQNVGNRAIFFI